MASRRRRTRRATAWNGLVRFSWSSLLLLASSGAVGTYFAVYRVQLLTWPHFWSLSAFVSHIQHSALLPAIGASLWLLFGVMGAITSWRYHHHRQHLLRNARNLAAVKALDWQQFELLVGQLYRQHGYRVTETGLGGADGGIDLIAEKWGSGEKVVVQCKHYRVAFVGAPVVRELYGLMAHHHATSAAVVCCGRFTSAAHAFAQGKPLTLIGAEELLACLHVARNR